MCYNEHNHPTQTAYHKTIIIGPSARANTLLKLFRPVPLSDPVSKPEPETRIYQYREKTAFPIKEAVGISATGPYKYPITGMLMSI